MTRKSGRGEVCAVEDADQMMSPELTQIVRPGLPGVHEPGLEQELSDEDLVC